MNFISRYTAFGLPYWWITVLLLTLSFSLLLSFSFSYFVSLSFSVLFLKCLIDTIFLLILAVLLDKVIPSSNYVKLDITQRAINYIALAIITILIWVAITYLSSLVLFGSERNDEIVKLLPVTALIGLLLFIIDTQYLYIINAKHIDENGAEPVIKNEKANIEDQTGSFNESENKKVFLERIAVKIGQKINVINVNDIFCIQSDGDYVQIFTEKGKYIKEDTMKYFESNLSSQKFVRVHRSFIVNVEKIARIELYEKNNQMLILKNGNQIKTSTAGYKMLRGVLKL